MYFIIISIDRSIEREILVQKKEILEMSQNIEYLGIIDGGCATVSKLIRTESSTANKWY